MNDFLAFLPTLIKWIPALGELLEAIINDTDASLKSEVEAILSDPLKKLHDTVDSLDD